MAGGLIQLVAFGEQNIYLTNDPQITFFKVVYRRHTNFSTEPIQQPFTHIPDFGRRVTCILSRNGDLIRKIYLVAILPRIPNFKDANDNIDQLAKFAWVRKIGYALIQRVEVEIGGESIDIQYGDWLNIWDELTLPNRKNRDILLGNVTELTDYSNGKPQYQLFIPLEFWFNRWAGLALPAVSLQYNHIKINVDFQDFSNLYTLAPTHYINVDNDFVNFEPFEYIIQTVNGVSSLAQFVHFDIINRALYLKRISDNGFLSVTVTDPSLIQTEDAIRAILYATDVNGNYINQQYFITGLTTEFEAMPQINATETVYLNTTVNFNNISLVDSYLLVEYVFLDEEERVRFSQAKHEYLIEQIIYNGENTINGVNQKFKLSFTQPCKELHWVTQLTLAQNLRNNDTFNYTDSMVRDEFDQLIGGNIIQNMTIEFNGQDRISFRDFDYFGSVQPYQHHTHSPSTGIGVYSMCLHPEKLQPSGSANFSRIDNLRMRLSVITTITFQYTAKLRVYAMVYNVLRIANGISGLVFSNDLGLMTT